MTSNLPNYSIEKAGDYDSTGSYRVNILTRGDDGLVERELAGYVRPVIGRTGRPRRWQPLIDGVPIGSPMRTRALAVAVVLQTWQRDHA